MSKHIHNAQLIRTVLRITEQAYHDLLLNEGMRYLDLYMGTDTIGREVLRDMPLFWDWWKRSFDIRNATFIGTHELAEWGPRIDKWERSQLMHLYTEMHSAEMLEIRPTRQVMRNTLRTVRIKLNLK